jgi:hypothetical protein
VAAVNEEFRAGRGFVYVRETAPGTVVVSFYPYSQSDDAWPGSIQTGDQIDGFPVDAARQGERAAVEAFVKQHPAWQ